LHEVSLASALVELVREELARAGAQRATKVTIEIGALSHVDARALRFAFESAIMDGPAAEADLVIEEPPGRAWCLDCSDVVTIEKRGEACPVCNGYKLLVQGGDEMKFKSMEVA
jgi:hydrogenase nickel incorporation protein HypA/HybF